MPLHDSTFRPYNVFSPTDADDFEVEEEAEEVQTPVKPAQKRKQAEKSEY